MGNLNDRVNEQRGTLRRIIGLVPGFSGYSDREKRREADKLEREFVAQKIVAQKTAVRRVMDELLSAGKIEGISDFEKINNKIDKLAARIRNASYGWTGLFDAIEIRAAELEKLYQYDLGVVEGATELANAIAEMQKLATDAPAARAKARDVAELVDRIDDYFSRRTELVTRG